MKMSTISPKVAILMQNFRGGGYERMMINLAREWAKMGIEVDLLLIDPVGEYRHLVPTSVRKIDLSAKRTLTSIVPLIRYLRRHRPRALLSGLPHLNAVAALAGVSALVSTRIVLSERNTPSREKYSSDRATRLGYRLARWAYANASAVIAVSDGVADDMAACLSVPRLNVHVIPNPVVTQELRELAQQPLAHPWFAPEQPPVVLAVGRLAVQKDYTTLLRAFAAARAAICCKLVILGEGPERGRLAALATKLGIGHDVDMPGFAANPYAFMKRCALFVLSSRYEGSPNVLVEAMASGACVVATDCPNGPREILRGGALAPLVAIGDVHGLTNAIINKLRHEHPVEPLTARAATFDAGRSAESYLKVLLGDCLASGPVRRNRR